MSSPPTNLKDQVQPKTLDQMAKGPAGKPLQSLQTPHRPHPTGISDESAKEAHDFMQSTTRRMSDSQSAHSPGLTDELVQQNHVFWDSNATRRKSHSKYLPDVTLPGMTDEVIEGVLEFEEAAEGPQK
jgi:hypothetical protein